MIYCLEIYKPYRKLGYSKILLQQIEKWMFNNNVEILYLEVEHDNNIAHDIYIKYGFTESLRQITDKLHMKLKVRNL